MLRVSHLLGKLSSPRLRPVLPPARNAPTGLQIITLRQLRAPIILRGHVTATLPTTMSGESGYHHRGTVIGTKIFNLLHSLGPATYDEISPNIEYWIDYGLTEQSVNANDLVDQLSSMTWDTSRSSDADVARFLKQFRDAPRRSEKARSFVDGLCSRVLQLFAVASVEDLISWDGYNGGNIARYGGEGFICAASLVGHLIECGVLDHELIRRHLIKPLISHHYTGPYRAEHKYFRAAAIYKLLTTAGNVLLRGLLKPEDLQLCFETLDSEIPSGRVAGLNGGKLLVRCAAHPGESHI